MEVTLEPEVVLPIEEGGVAPSSAVAGMTLNHRALGFREAMRTAHFQFCLAVPSLATPATASREGEGAAPRASMREGQL